MVGKCSCGHITPSKDTSGHNTHYENSKNNPTLFPLESFSHTLKGSSMPASMVDATDTLKKKSVLGKAAQVFPT